MGKKRAKRREVKPKGKGSMRGMRSGLKKAAGAVDPASKKGPSWSNWIVWGVLAIAAALLLSRALS